MAEKKFNLLCAMFGHRPEGPGWWGDVPYVIIRQGGTDNIGRIHGMFYHECRRCQQKYLAGRFHINDQRILSALGIAALSTAESGK